MPAGSKDIKIEEYVLMHSLNKAGSINCIACFNKGSNIGDIDFYRKGEVPVSKILVNNEKRFVFHLYCEIDRFQDIITTLRYEKPLDIFLSWDSNNNVIDAVISTAHEPTGEQEGV
jgi:hypothetical protein